MKSAKQNTIRQSIDRHRITLRGDMVVQVDFFSLSNQDLKDLTL